MSELQKMLSTEKIDLKKRLRRKKYAETIKNQKKLKQKGLREMLADRYANRPIYLGVRR